MQAHQPLLTTHRDRRARIDRRILHLRDVPTERCRVDGVLPCLLDHADHDVLPYVLSPRACAGRARAHGITSATRGPAQREGAPTPAPDSLFEAPEARATNCGGPRRRR